MMRSSARRRHARGPHAASTPPIRHPATGRIESPPVAPQRAPSTMDHADQRVPAPHPRERRRRSAPLPSRARPRIAHARASRTHAPHPLLRTRPTLGPRARIGQQSQSNAPGGTAAHTPLSTPGLARMYGEPALAPLLGVRPQRCSPPLATPPSLPLPELTDGSATRPKPPRKSESSCAAALARPNLLPPSPTDRLPPTPVPAPPAPHHLHPSTPPAPRS